MSKIVSIVSSPRKGGYGDTLASIAEGSARNAGSEVIRFDLNDMGSFSQCQNCEGCKKDGECVLNDDISPVIDAIREADGIILCTSINFNDMDGLFKMVIDRLYCFLDMNASTIMPKGKRLGVIVTAGADQTSADRVSSDLERMMSQHFFCEPAGRIAYCTWMMPLGMPIDDGVTKEAEEMGRRLAARSPNLRL